MDIHTLRHALRADYESLGSWRLVAERWRLSKGMAFRIARRNYEPKSPVIRLQLGLPLPEARIIPVAGPIPDGAQALGALRCSCGQWFIPNTPTRKHCFICSPFRRRKIAR